jgi:Transposase DDE domain
MACLKHAPRNLRYDSNMTKSHGAMHVATVTSRQVDKAGRQREYQSHLVRRTYREGGKVKHQTLANITALPPAAIEAIRAVLRGQQLAPVGQALQITRALPHGHVAAVWAQARALGLPALLGPAGRYRDLALALIIARVLHPASKLATGCWWDDTTLGADLGVAGASTDDIYAAMDWLLTRQDAIQATLAKRHLGQEANPSGMALFDLSSSWLEGSHCPLAARGYSRDGRKGTLQIEYGLLTDPEGRPVAIKVFAGNTADPTAFLDAVQTVRDSFGLTRLVLIGDRGMITNARIAALRADPGSELGWLTALRAPAIKALAADGGPLQPTLFDQQDLAEIHHPDYPGERLIACRNPYLAKERARKRSELLHATEDALAPVVAAVAAGRLSGADRIGLKVGKIINKHKMAKHFQVAITDTSLRITRNNSQIAAEAALDGIYVLRTSVPAEQLDAVGVVIAYKNLANVERDFRSLKVDDLDLRPIYHRLADRVRAHVLICMLAGYLTWHLRSTVAPLTYTDEHPPTRDNPVASASRSTAAESKASRHRDTNNNPIWSFRGLLDHLATLTRNQVRVAGTEHTVTILAEPTPTQQRVFDLLNQPLPLTLT